MAHLRYTILFDKISFFFKKLQLCADPNMQWTDKDSSPEDLNGMILCRPEAIGMEPFLCLDRLFIMRKFFVMWEGGLKRFWILSHVCICHYLYIQNYFWQSFGSLGIQASEITNYRLRSQKEIARKLRITIGNQEKDILKKMPA